MTLLELYQLIFRYDDLFFNETLTSLIQEWTNNTGPMTSSTQAIAFLDFDNDTVPEIEIFGAIGYYVDENYNFYSP